MTRREPVGKAVHRIAREEIKRAIRDLSTEEDLRHIGVHEARKRFKKLRSLLRLVKKPMGRGYAQADAFFRDMGKRLAAARDAQAVIESFDQMLEASPDAAGDRQRFAEVRARLEDRRDDLMLGHADLDHRMAEAVTSLMDMRKRVKQWRFSERGFEAIGPGFERCYDKARDAMNRAYRGGDDYLFHNWRKGVKDHWHHIRLLRNLWRPIMQVLIQQLDSLAELLGHDHDLSVLRNALNSEDRFDGLRELPALLALIDRRKVVVRHAAHELGNRLFAETPHTLHDRFARYWKAWRHHRKPPKDLQAIASLDGPTTPDSLE